MPFKKGHSGNPSGRPIGAVNKTTKELREQLSTIIQEEIQQLPSYFKSITDNKTKIELLSKFLPYIVPKMQSIKQEVNEKEELREIKINIVRPNGQ